MIYLALLHAQTESGRLLHRTDHVVVAKLDPARSGHDVGLETLERR